MILRALQKDNDQLDVPDRVTIDSIRNHTRRHFPVQNVAKATYRRILERRAQENGMDFIKGVATATAIMPVFTATVSVDGEVVSVVRPNGVSSCWWVSPIVTMSRRRKRLAEKLWQLSLLDDELSAADVGAPILVVGQFTLYANTAKGRRPTWNAAAPDAVAEPLVSAFADACGGWVHTWKPMQLHAKHAALAWHRRADRSASRITCGPSSAPSRRTAAPRAFQVEVGTHSSHR
jgi:D-aminoacyl-tRNA deacylase